MEGAAAGVSYWALVEGKALERTASGKVEPLDIGILSGKVKKRIFSSGFAERDSKSNR